MELDLQPPQPEPVERVVQQLLARPAPAKVDLWWRAGLAEALGDPDEREPGA